MGPAELGALLSGELLKHYYLRFLPLLSSDEKIEQASNHLLILRVMFLCLFLEKIHAPESNLSFRRTGSPLVRSKKRPVRLCFISPKRS
jgi:hypothetical protein